MSYDTSRTDRTLRCLCRRMSQRVIYFCSVSVLGTRFGPKWSMVSTAIGWNIPQTEITLRFEYRAGTALLIAWATGRWFMLLKRNDSCEWSANKSSRWPQKQMEWLCIRWLYDITAYLLLPAHWVAVYVCHKINTPLRAFSKPWSKITSIRGNTTCDVITKVVGICDNSTWWKVSK